MAERPSDGRPLILAIYLSARGLGFVVLEGDDLIDWGTKTARGDKNAETLAKIGELVDWHKPDLLVLEHSDAPDSRRAPRVRQLDRRVNAWAKARRLPVSAFSRSQVKAAFSSRRASTKYQIAQQIARHLPDLAPWLPPPRKIWESEDPRLSIFGAAALALTFRAADMDEQARQAA